MFDGRQDKVQAGFSGHAPRDIEGNPINNSALQEKHENHVHMLCSKFHDAHQHPRAQPNVVQHRFIMAYKRV